MITSGLELESLSLVMAVYCLILSLLDKMSHAGYAHSTVIRNKAVARIIHHNLEVESEMALFKTGCGTAISVSGVSGSRSVTQLLSEGVTSVDLSSTSKGTSARDSPCGFDISDLESGGSACRSSVSRPRKDKLKASQSGVK